MKKVASIIFATFVIAICAVMISSNDSKAVYAYPSNVTQVSATANSARIQWTPDTSAVGYALYTYEGGADGVLVGTTTDNFAEIPNLYPGCQYKYVLYALVNETDLYGNPTGQMKKSGCEVFTIKTIPNVVGAIKPQLILTSSLNGWYNYQTVTNVDGYQIQAYDTSGKVTWNYYNANGFSSTVATTFKKNAIGMVRYRPYIMCNNQRFFGPWSALTAYAHFRAKGKSKYSLFSKYKKVNISWPKVKGAKGYYVYASTNKDSGYKKVKTLSAKKRSCTIYKRGKAKLKKYTTYYFRIVCKAKIGGKTKKIKPLIVYSV